MLEYASAAARRLLLFAVFTASSMLANSAVAWESDPDRSVVMRHGSIADLHLFDFQQRREGFQQEQTRFREVDRLRATAQPRRPKIPRLPRKCLPPIGNNILGTCR